MIWVILAAVSGLVVGAIGAFNFLIWVLTHCDPADLGRSEWTPERAELARKIREMGSAS